MSNKLTQVRIPMHRVFPQDPMTPHAPSSAFVDAWAYAFGMAEVLLLPEEREALQTRILERNGSTIDLERCYFNIMNSDGTMRPIQLRFFCQTARL